VKLDLSTATGQLQTSRDKQASGSESFLDGIVGARGKINPNNNWYMPYYMDAGTGQSDLTLQVMAGIDYQFKWGDIQLAYRHFDYEFDSDFLPEDLTVRVQLLGARFKF